MFRFFLSFFLSFTNDNDRVTERNRMSRMSVDTVRMETLPDAGIECVRLDCKLKLVATGVSVRDKAGLKLIDGT